MDDYYVVQDAFANALPDSLLVSRTVFDELGKLAQQGCFFAFQAAFFESPDLESCALNYVRRVKSLLESHSCSALPAFDHHSVNIHVALLLLIVAGERKAAEQWLMKLCQRLCYATAARKFLPLSATFEDALAVREGEMPMAAEFCSTSTLLPILLVWVAALDMHEAYNFLRAEVLPNLKGTTPNLWSSEEGFDDVVGNGQTLQTHGIGEVLGQIPEKPSDFLLTMSARLPGINGIETSSWYQLRAPFIPLLAGVYWQLQLPREMLVQQAVAFATKSHSSDLQSEAGS
jgi:hypothetical protein